MEKLQSIYKNPFRILGASPVDNRHHLIELADEASLLGEENAEDAVNQLLNPQRRLDAEINWFPNTDTAQVEAILAYGNAEKAAPYPPLPEGSALAAFNAARVLLETWEVKNNASAVALCESLAILDVQISAETLFEELDNDRRKSNFQVLPENIDDVVYRLEGLRRGAAQRILERVEERPDVKMYNLMNQLALFYKECPSMLIELLINGYELKVKEKCEKLKEEILSKANSVTANRIMAPQTLFINSILTMLKDWFQLTAPMRHIQREKGMTDNDAGRLFHDVREMAVEIQNKHNMTNECASVINVLSELFKDLPGAKELLDADKATIRKIEMARMAAQRYT